MTFFEECSNQFTELIAGAFAVLLVGIIALLALTLSRKWFFGLVIVPPLYLLALELSEMAFVLLTFVTLGLPLIICL